MVICQQNFKNFLKLFFNHEINSLCSSLTVKFIYKTHKSATPKHCAFVYAVLPAMAFCNYYLTPLLKKSQDIFSKKENVYNLDTYKSVKLWYNNFSSAAAVSAIKISAAAKTYLPFLKKTAI